MEKELDEITKVLNSVNEKLDSIATRLTILETKFNPIQKFYYLIIVTMLTGIGATLTVVLK